MTWFKESFKARFVRLQKLSHSFQFHKNRGCDIGVQDQEGIRGLSGIGKNSDQKEVFWAGIHQGLPTITVFSSDRVFYEKIASQRLRQTISPHQSDFS